LLLEENFPVTYPMISYWVKHMEQIREYVCAVNDNGVVIWCTWCLLTNGNWRHIVQ